MEGLVENLRTVLLIEDDSNDEALGLRGLSRSELPLLVQVARDGQGALDVLGIEGEPPASKPDLIICDLKLPKVGGKDILRATRAIERFDGVPVVMFSSSDEPGDIQDCKRGGANAYIQKPLDYDTYLDKIRGIADLWLSESPAKKEREFVAVTGSLI